MFATRSARMRSTAVCLMLAIELAALVSEGPPVASQPQEFTALGTSVTGPITGNVTWTKLGNPYWIEGPVTVTSGSSLTMEPGVEVRFHVSGPIVSFAVEGRLELNGSDMEPVIFTTNVTVPAPLPWSLSSDRNGTILARYATMEYGALGVGSSGSNTRGILVLQNVSYVRSTTSISIWSAGDVRVSGSRIEPPAGIQDGLQVEDTATLSVSNSTILSPSQGANGVQVISAGRVVIDGNVIDGFAEGIRLIGTIGSGAVVARNEITGATNGMELQVTNAIVSGNEIRRCSQWGMRLWPDSSGSRVTGNVISDCGSGVYVSGSRDIVVSDNVVSNSTYEGILLNSVSYATVFGNTVEGSGRRGLELRGGAWHYLYWNRILRNAVQANDTSTNTLWDAGDLAGGNYWSDYVGDDLYHGPNQDLPGPDGFGDTPYVIDADSEDRYPLYPAPASGIPRELTAKAVGNDVVLTWQAAPKADAYLLYVADEPTGFDFSSAIALGNVTSWTDPGAAVVLGERYYVLRAHNTTVNRTSATSNTAGKWAQGFAGRTTTLSLPLRPYPWIDYAQPGWMDTVGELLAATGGARIGYMDAGRWRYVPGDGDPSRPVRVGEGYIAAAPSQVTFTGLPGTMIDYAGWPPYALQGFDPATTAREIAVRAVGDDVVLEWTQLPEIPPPNGAYEVRASRTPAGLRGNPGIDYRVLATVPATAAPRRSYMHSGALAASPEWYYMVIPARDQYWRGSSTYSVGVVAADLSPGHAAVALPLRLYENGTYLARSVSSLVNGGVNGVLWFDPSREDWVAHAAWMPPGTYDTLFVMIMAVQIDATSPTRIVFVGV